MPRATIESVDDYAVDDSRIELRCTLTFDHVATSEKYELPRTDVPVVIDFYTPGTFRFELLTDETANGGEAGVELNEKGLTTPVELAVSEEGGDLVLETDMLRIRIGLDEWTYTVESLTGRALLEEQRGDVDTKGTVRTDPIGFSLEQVNRWPFRTDSAGSSFVLYADEHLYGLGEKFTDFDKRGQRIQSWITQPNGSETELSYKNVPFYLSSRGYGLLVDTTQHVTFDMGDTSTISKEITVDDDRFEYVFIYGPEFKSILDDYTTLTGRPGELPKWTLGTWMSRMAYQSREEVEEVVSEIRDRDFPADVINLDPPWLREDHLCDFVWDREAFPDPEGMIDELHEEGFKICLWEYPYLLRRTEAYQEAVENEYLVKNTRGRPYKLIRLSWAPDRGGIVDFTNPEAREWWKDRHRELIDMGVDAFKTDFGEYLPRDAIMADGQAGVATRNRFSLLYTGTVYQAMKEAGVDPVLWARPGWTGGQQYPIHWSGDPNSTFEAMASTFRGGLSIGLCGYAFWSADIGGYSGNPSTELYIRWSQLALLGMSHARFHGTSPREPWEFGEEAAEIITAYARERYRLLPYIHRLSIEATETGLPVMRPLVLEFQSDPASRTQQTQSMLGEALLIAPIFDEAREREVYLPPGSWVDYWTGDRYEGGQTIVISAPLDTMPVFQRAGTIVPRRDATRYVDETPPDEIELRTVLSSEVQELETTVYAFDDNGEEISVTVDTVETGLSVDFDLPDDPSRFTAVVQGLHEIPSLVMQNGVELAKRESDPAAGEWTANEAGESIEICFGGRKSTN